MVLDCALTSWKMTSNCALWASSVALSSMKQQWALVLLVPLNGQQVELVPQVRVEIRSHDHTGWCAPAWRQGGHGRAHMAGQHARARWPLACWQCHWMRSGVGGAAEVPSHLSAMTSRGRGEGRQQQRSAGTMMLPPSVARPDLAGRPLLVTLKVYPRSRT